MTTAHLIIGPGITQFKQKIMNLRFLFVVLCLTTLLICVVSLRNANRQLFYKLCVTKTEQNQLKQQLWQKQLRLENLINPAAVGQLLENKKESKK